MFNRFRSTLIYIFISFFLASSLGYLLNLYTERSSNYEDQTLLKINFLYEFSFLDRMRHVDRTLKSLKNELNISIAPPYRTYNQIIIVRSIFENNYSYYKIYDTENILDTKKFTAEINYDDVQYANSIIISYVDSKEAIDNKLKYIENLLNTYIKTLFYEVDEFVDITIKKINYAKKVRRNKIDYLNNVNIFLSNNNNLIKKIDDQEILFNILQDQLIDSEDKKIINENQIQNFFNNYIVTNTKLIENENDIKELELQLSLLNSDVLSDDFLNSIRPKIKPKIVNTQELNIKGLQYTIDIYDYIILFFVILTLFLVGDYLKNRIRYGE